MAESWICRCSRGTLYDVLQVSPWCEPEVIQAAYRALARSRHPDLNREPDAEDQMRRLNAAYSTLSDPLRRARYDEELALEAAGSIAGRNVARTVEAPWPPSPAASTMTAEPPASPASGTVGARRSIPMDDRVPSDRASGERVSATPAMFMDAADGPVLPRSALYVSVVLVTAIVVLVLWLVIDALVDRQTPSFRAGYGEDRSLLNAPQSPWSFNVVAPSQNPGLSR
jgi:curved DNA-binding protein CbpA